MSNRPRKGSICRVEPIRSQAAIESIKKLLRSKPRDLLLFVLGINCNLRGCDLLNIKVGAVRHLGVGDALLVREKKTGKLRRINLNKTVFEAIQLWLTARPDLRDCDPLFPSRKGGKPLGTSYLNRLVKGWCKAVGLTENYGGHTLRKTFGYIHRVVFQTDLPTLMRLYNHSSERQTLDYLGIQQSEVERAYLKEI